jgi:hypothetical protein
MFRFTIRDVLWLTVVVALAVGWWIDRTRQAASADRLAVLEAVIGAERLTVTFDKEGEDISQIKVWKKQ